MDFKKALKRKDIKPGMMVTYRYDDGTTYTYIIVEEKRYFEMSDTCINLYIRADDMHWDGAGYWTAIVLTDLEKIIYGL